MFTALDGVASTSTRIGNDEVDIVVMFEPEFRRDASNLLKIPITTPTGQYVPLSSVARVENQLGRASIQRLNGKRTLTIFGEVNSEILTSKEGQRENSSVHQSKARNC